MPQLTSRGGSGRARRYPVHLPILFRAVGEASWNEGQTENISRSGVLFDVEEPLPVETLLELGLVLQPNGKAQSAPQVLCRACVVRSAPADGEAARPAVAARIWEYHFIAAECRAQWWMQ